MSIAFGAEFAVSTSKPACSRMNVTSLRSTEFSSTTKMVAGGLEAVMRTPAAGKLLPQLCSPAIVDGEDAYAAHRERPTAMMNSTGCIFTDSLVGLASPVE